MNCFKPLKLIFFAINLLVFNSVVAQNSVFCNLDVTSSVIRQVQVKLDQKCKMAELSNKLQNANEQTDSSAIVAITDSSNISRESNPIIFLKSGTNWAINGSPARPKLYQTKALFRSKNEAVVNYSHFVDFCQYYEENKELNYSDIDYIVVNEVFVKNNETVNRSYKIRFDSTGKISITY